MDMQLVSAWLAIVGNLIDTLSDLDIQTSSKPAAQEPPMH